METVCTVREESASGARQGARASAFRPDPARASASQLAAFIAFCETRLSRRFPDYPSFEAFARGDFRSFWRLFLVWSGLEFEGDAEPVCVGDDCERARFFPNLRLSYAASVLGSGDGGAITSRHGDGTRHAMTQQELRRSVAALAAGLAGLGVGEGDRCAAIVRNRGEAIVAALACAALGAAFSSCGPEMGAFSILSRFSPLEPVLLFAHLRPEPWDAGDAVAVRVAEVAGGLPSVRTVVALDDGAAPMAVADRVARYESFLGRAAIPGEPGCKRFPFDHPLFVLFSSGTTGKPKCIVHGAGGTLLEHVKEHRLHCDLRPGDRLFFQTSCGWMMWNWQLSALASGVELVLYDGPIAGPETLWDIVAAEKVTVFGTSPAYLRFCEQAGYRPGRELDLRDLRSVLSTGSILYDSQFDWVREAVSAGILLQSISGGTDIIGCFVLGNPLLPVYRGEAQCRSLGLDVRASPIPGAPGPVGELVCANPFPSRPVGFHGDRDGRALHAAYFEQNRGFWTHGDLIEFGSEGGARLHGRSDGILNIRGVRVGPSEIHRILEDVPEISDSMAVAEEAPDEPGGARLILLLVLVPGRRLDPALESKIRATLARRGTAALVPQRILQLEDLPTTHSGKRSHAAAADAVNGREAGNRAAMHNPHVLDDIARLMRGDPAADAPPPDEPAAEDGLERLVQRICAAVLRVRGVGRHDNFFELGGSSLGALRIFAEIRRRTGCDLPIQTLFHSPTVASLAATLRAQRGAACAAAAASAEAPGAPRLMIPAPVEVRPIAAGDIEPVCRFLRRAFGGSIDESLWRRLFDHPWIAEPPDRGFALCADGRLVGFLGTVYGNRTLNGKSGVVCNLTSLYIEPEHRGWAPRLIATALADETASYTILTPGRTVWEMCEAMGFESLHASRLFLPPLADAGSLKGGGELLFDPDQVRAALGGEEQRMFDDHRAYECLQFVLRDGRDVAFIVAKRRAIRRVPVSELLYCGAPAALERNLERVKLAVLRRQRTLALSVDPRILKTRRRGLRLPQRAAFRSPVFTAGDIDRLYSEIVLLPI